MGEPIGQGHTQRGRWEEPLAALSVLGKGHLRAVPQRGRWEELLAARQLEQIRSNAEEKERGAAPNPDEGSKAIEICTAREAFHNVHNEPVLAGNHRCGISGNQRFYNVRARKHLLSANLSFHVVSILTTWKLRLAAQCGISGTNFLPYRSSSSPERGVIG